MNSIVHFQSKMYHKLRTFEIDELSSSSGVDAAIFYHIGFHRL